MKLLKKTILVMLLFVASLCLCAVAASAQLIADESGTIGFYDSESYQYRWTKLDGEFFVGGGRIDGWDYKSLTIYTNMKPTMVDPDGDGPKSPKKGKITAVVTSTPYQPAVVKGKVTKDKEAEKVMKASYSSSNGKIKLTANKKPGKVYLHLLDIDCNKNVAQHISLPVTVGEVCKKIEITDSNGNNVKKINLNIGEKIIFDINTITRSGGIAKDSYLEIYDENEEFSSEKGADNYLDVDVFWNNDTGKGELTIMADRLKEDSYKNPVFTKTSFTIWDRVSGKKAKISVTMVDTTDEVYATSLYDGFLHYYEDEERQWKEDEKWKNRTSLVNKKDIVGVYYTVWTVAKTEFSTDKVKVYVCKAGTTPVLDSKGKLTYTKSSDVKATLKNPTGNCRYENAGRYIELKANVDKPNCGIYSVHTDPATKTSKLFYLGSVKDGVVYDERGDEIK